MELRTELEIDATPSEVWDVLLDHRRFGEWNPFITAVEGELAAGQRPVLTLSLPQSGDMRIRPTVLVVRKAEELRWRGQLLASFVFSGEHFFQLSELPGGRTRLVHGEDFSGWLVRYLGNKLTETARALVFMNHALKKRVESLSAAPA